MSQTIHYTTTDSPQPRPSTSRSPSRPTSQPSRPTNERSSLSADRLPPRNYGGTSDPNGHTTTTNTNNNNNTRQTQTPSPHGENDSDSNSVGTFTNSNNDTNNGTRTSKGKAKAEGGAFRAWARQFWTLELENKGSVARDHLALERTFLAWLRTSLAFASIGIAITQLFRLNAAITPASPSSHSSDSLQRLGKPLGGCFIGLALLSLVCGVHRYYEAQGWLLRGKYPASRGGVLVLTVAAGGVVVGSLVVVLALGRGG